MIGRDVRPIATPHMRRTLILAGVLAVSLSLGYRPLTGQSQKAAANASSATPRALLDQYCVGCHNAKTRAGGLALDLIDPSHAGDHAEQFEKVVTRLRSGLMPPLGAKRPDPATLDALVSGIEAELDKASAANPKYVAPGVHRVNRTEYANAIKDLLAVDVDPS